mgnify:CR=1 FL=1
MSILNVEHLSHGFGDRAIFQDVSFRLLKGEHIGLIGANGEGKSTVYEYYYRAYAAGRGKVEWSKAGARRLSGSAHGAGKRHDDPRGFEERIFLLV